MHHLNKLLKKDFTFVVYSIFLIPLSWFIFLGWKPNLSIAGNDGITYTQPRLLEFFSKGGDWLKFLLRHNPVGGSAGHAVGGTVPLYEICALLGLSSVTTENCFCFLIQILVAFFSFKIVSDLTLYSEEKDSFKKILTMTGLIWLTAFSPLVGWRLYYGHEMLFMGFVPLLIVFSLLISAAKNTFSISQFVLAVIGVSHSLSGMGQQGIVYSAFFGLPLLYFAIKQSKPRQVSMVLLVCAGAAFSIAPRFYFMLKYALSSDASRPLDAASVVYHYTTGNAWDWVSSLPWSLEIFQIERNKYFLHETNYAIGPIFLAFLMLPIKKYRSLIVGISISAVAAIFFSDNFILGDLLKNLPLIKSFRVPERTFISVGLFLPILATISLIELFQLKEKISSPFKIYFGLLSAIVLLLILDSVQREALLWFSVLFTIAIVRLKVIPLQRFISHEILIAFLGIGSVLAFAERSLPYVPTGEYAAQAKILREKILEKHPELENPLQRIKMNSQIRYLGVNTSSFLQLSSIDGYEFAPSRFLRLEAALNQTPYDSTKNYFNFESGNAATFPLRTLYNVSESVQMSGDLPQFENPIKTPGAAWLSHSMVAVKNEAELAEKLKSPKLTENLLEKNWVIEEDFPRSIRSAQCLKSKITELLSARDQEDTKISIKVAPGEACALTLSMNYYEFMRAESDQLKLTTFPAYGSLLGIWVPEGEHHIVVSPDRHIPVAVKIIQWIGFLLTLAYFLFFGLKAFTKK